MGNRYTYRCGANDEHVSVFRDFETQEALQRLAYFEDLQEHGRLVELPCELGDKVYWISSFSKNIQCGVAKSMKLSRFGFDLELLCDGDRIVKRELEKVFLTHEAVEIALKSLKSETA